MARGCHHGLKPNHTMSSRVTHGAPVKHLSCRAIERARPGSSYSGGAHGLGERDRQTHTGPHGTSCVRDGHIKVLREERAGSVQEICVVWPGTHRGGGIPAGPWRKRERGHISKRHD